jgi:hypothetical protein
MEVDEIIRRYESRASTMVTTSHERMTVEEMRQIAPTETEGMSDEEIEELREIVYRLAAWSLEQIRQDPERYR